MAVAYWTPAAEADLEEIVVFIAEQQHRRDTAQRVFNAIRTACDEQAGRPGAGQLYPHLGPSIRGFTHQRWLVLYQAKTNGIEIRAVVDSARDYLAWLPARLGD